MNPDLLRAESPHVQEEFDKLRFLNAVQEQALLLASAAHQASTPRSALSGPVPGEDASEQEWLDYWVGQGAIELAEKL